MHIKKAKTQAAFLRSVPSGSVSAYEVSHPNEPIALFHNMCAHVCASLHACLTHVWGVVWRPASISCFCFSKAYANKGRRLRMGEGVEIEQWAYFADGSGWFPRRYVCVCMMRVYKTGFAWVHTWKEESLFITPCFASLSPSLLQFPGHHLSWARPNHSPEIHLHSRTYCINLTPPFSIWTRVKFHRSVSLLLRT